MNRVLVRCWPVELYQPRRRVYVTYPEGSSGHNLWSCIECGEIYAANVAKEIYIGPPIMEKLAQLSCKSCGAGLEKTARQYPQNHLASNKELQSYDVPRTVPKDIESRVMEFWGIYD